MLCQEPWKFEFESFDGGWSLADCNESASDSTAILCVARMLVLRVVANAVRRQLRGEDLGDDISWTEEYVAALGIDDRHARTFRLLLGALRPFDPGQVTELLLAACALAGNAAHEGSARGFAELAYDAATAHGLDANAQGAALALARLAKLQEAPWSSRMWSAIGRMHARRDARKRFAVV